MTDIISDTRFAPQQFVESADTGDYDSRYWPSVWRRLRSDPAALVAAFTLLLLCSAVVSGPWWWRVEPSQQFLSQINASPMSARSALVVDGYAPWQPDGTLITSITVVQANTEFVRLRWPAVPDAVHYLVYRTDRLQHPGPGLALDELDASQLWFEDRLNLQQKPYRYTLVAQDAAGLDVQRISLEVTPALALSIYGAELLGVIPNAAAAVDVVGKPVMLPAHPLGTDHLGRDVLARLLSGGRMSLFIGTVAPLIYVLFGVLYGATSALIGGRVDALMMNVADFVVALPFLLFMILIRVALGVGPGESGVSALLAAMIVLGWPHSARLVRGEILKLRELPYVQAARLMGAGRGYLIARHLLPNIMGSVLVTFTFAIPSAVFTEAFLSFIGMGVVPPATSWGSMCNDGLRTLLTYPHTMLFPALAISITVLVFNLLGDGLRDAMAIHHNP